MRTGTLSIALVTIGSVLGTLPATAQIQERTIRWGHLNNTDHPVSFGVQKFAEVLAAKSGGKQEILSASTTSLASVVKELGLFDFPFIVSTFEQAESLALGPFGQAMR